MSGINNVSTERVTIDEMITEISLSEIHSFKNHPFKVVDDERMMDTAESIRAYGVLIPVIVRPRKEGVFEMISGHRRKRGSELAGLDRIPAIVRDLDDDAATIVMVDSNLQREALLPSEKAFAYKMKMDAIKRSAGRTAKKNCDQIGHNSFGKRTGHTHDSDRCSRMIKTNAFHSVEISIQNMNERSMNAYFVPDIDQSLFRFRGLLFYHWQQFRMEIQFGEFPGDAVAAAHQKMTIKMISLFF